MKEDVLDLLKKRKSYGYIAEKLGMSRSRVAGIAYRNKSPEEREALKKKQEEKKRIALLRSRQKKKPALFRHKTNSLAPLRIPSNTAVKANINSHRLKRDYIPVAGDGRVRFVDAVALRGCLWIDGDVTGNTMCCGAKRKLGRPYCEPHYAASTLPSKPVDIERLADRF